MGKTRLAVEAAEEMAGWAVSRLADTALLVSQGLSNRHIAEAMSLSVRTVEGHIYRATVKAGVATRDELSTMVKQFDAASVSSG